MRRKGKGLWPSDSFPITYIYTSRVPPLPERVKAVPSSSALCVHRLKHPDLLVLASKPSISRSILRSCCIEFIFRRILRSLWWTIRSDPEKPEIWLICLLRLLIWVHFWFYVRFLEIVLWFVNVMGLSYCMTSQSSWIISCRWVFDTDSDWSDLWDATDLCSRFFRFVCWSSCGS